MSVPPPLQPVRRLFLTAPTRLLPQVWTTVIVVNLLFIGVTLFSAVKGGLIANDGVGANFAGFSASSLSLTTVNENQQKNFKVLTYIFAACTGVLLLLTLLMASRLKIAIACLKVASLAINHMPLILFFPLVTLSVYVAFIIWWIFVTVFLYSCGTAVQDPSTGAWELTWTRQLQYVGVYHLFGLLWTTQFLVSFSHVVIAGAVSAYYWCRGDAESPEIRSPISSARRPHRRRRHSRPDAPPVLLLRFSNTPRLSLTPAPPPLPCPAAPQPPSTARGGTTWARSPWGPSSSPWCSSCGWCSSTWTARRRRCRRRTCL